ncbi:MAG: hypothetical protein ABI640_00915 [Gammaproteobacteria bacterium]
MLATALLEHLEPVHELNRSFLGFLQSRARVERDCLGLPATAHPPLRAADGTLLDNVAQFPHALFQIRCDSVGGVGQTGAVVAERDAPYHELALSILLAARHASRQSPYQAQFLLGLGVVQIELMRSLPLPDLARLAAGPDVVQCAFTDQDRLWHGILTDTRPESRRQLALVALQPGLARDWPQRRPAHPAT